MLYLYIIFAISYLERKNYTISFQKLCLSDPNRLHRREEPRQSDSQEVSTPTDLSLDKRQYRRDFSPGKDSQSTPTDLSLDKRQYRRDFSPGTDSQEVSTPLRSQPRQEAIQERLLPR
jgi:hypothetical protein